MALPSSKRRLQLLANQKVARRVGPASSLTSATQKPRGTTPFALSLLGGPLVGPGSGFGSRGFAEEVWAKPAAPALDWTPQCLQRCSGTWELITHNEWGQ